MRTAGTVDRLWPNAWQELLLDAAHAPDATAIAAFGRWCDRPLREEDFDGGSRRLLPLVYHRMQALGVSQPIMGRLKGTYRRAWYETNTVHHATAPAVAMLERNGIDTLLLKGVPLGLTYYGKSALRPMADIDVLVRPEQVRAAIALLTGAGWRPGPMARDEDVAFRHSMQFINGDAHEVDLHWHALLETCNTAADLHFWRSAEPLRFAGVATRQLSPANTLLHGIIHGLRWNAEPSIRWIQDGLVVLRTAGDQIDWPGLVEFTRSQRLTHRLALGLNYLAGRHAAEVPETVLRALAATRISLTERIENSVVLRDSGRLYAHPLTKQWVIFSEYCRMAGGRPRFVAGFPHYLRYRWRLRGRRELVSVILSGIWRRVTGRAL